MPSIFSLIFLWMGSGNFDFRSRSEAKGSVWQSMSIDVAAVPAPAVYRSWCRPSFLLQLLYRAAGDVCFQQKWRKITFIVGDGEQMGKQGCALIVMLLCYCDCCCCCCWKNCCGRVVTRQNNTDFCCFFNSKIQYVLCLIKVTVFLRIQHVLREL